MRAERMLFFSVRHKCYLAYDECRLMANYTENMATHSSVLGRTGLITCSGRGHWHVDVMSPNSCMLLTSPCWVR